MSMQNRIEGWVGEGLLLAHLEIVNESHKHAGPGRDTHFKVTVVSQEFEGISAVKRHQRVYALLEEALQEGVHALALHTYTPAEWQAKQGIAPASPACVGGAH